MEVLRRIRGKRGKADMRKAPVAEGIFQLDVVWEQVS